MYVVFAEANYLLMTNHEIFGLDPEVLAIIPARGGSKGILRKNIKDLAGKPLLEYTALAALKSTNIDRTILSTECPEIAAIGKNLGLDVPFLRPSALARDDSPSLAVFEHALSFLQEHEQFYKPRVLVVLQPTSPLRTDFHIDEALKKFFESTADSLVSVVRVPHNMIPQCQMYLNHHGFLVPYEVDGNCLMQRQQKPKMFARNGAAIYVTKIEKMLREKSLLAGNVLHYEMDFETSIDIDDQKDWDRVEKMMSRK